MQSQSVSSNGERDADKVTPEAGPIKRRHWLENSMEHSGIKISQPKQHHSGVQDGALLCLPILPLSDQPPPEEVGRELARCLHEPKYRLLKDVVEVIGVERSLQCFSETAQVQESGGVLISDGNKKRAPGGVFFAMVKKRTTEEEKKKIFSRDKRVAGKHTKKIREAKKRARWREEQKQRERETQEKAKKELEKFRKELEITASERELECANSYENIARKRERGGREGQRRRDGEGGQAYVDLDDPNTSLAEDGEIIEDEEEEEEEFHERGNSSVFEQCGNKVERDRRRREKGEADTRGSGRGGEKEIEEMETDSLSIVDDRTKNRLHNPSQEVCKTAKDEENDGSKRLEGGEKVEEVVGGSIGPALGASDAVELKEKAVEEEEAAAEQFESMNEWDLDLKLGLVFN